MLKVVMNPNYSAAMLVKMSAGLLNTSQTKLVNSDTNQIESPLRAFDANRENFVTNTQAEGQKFADACSRSEYTEMRSVFDYSKMSDTPSIKSKGLKIYYSIDEILLSEDKTEAFMIEHKKTTAYVSKRRTPFPISCIVQAAFYCSLFMVNRSSGNTVYSTADFARMKDGVIASVNILNLKGVTVSQWVNIDRQFFKITVFRPYHVLRFYLTKLRASLDLNDAKKFDKSWWDKEWQYIRESITVEHWNPYTKTLRIVQPYQVIAIYNNNLISQGRM